jgi:cellobiose phosphorylase
MVAASPRASQSDPLRWLLRHRKETADELFARLCVQDEPIRADLLSLDQLRHHAQTLAGWHQVADRPCRDRLLARFSENTRVLEETHRLLRLAAAEGHEISPAGVWLLDNYYLIQDQIRMARLHLPRKYSMELPQLVGGPSDGLPRVYELALELISHVDGQVDQENLHPFIGAYQEVTSLKLGELWAIPIMLRLALIENLRRVALRVAWQQHDQQLGEGWADRVLRASRRSFGEFIRSVEELFSQESALSSAFVAGFTQRLNGQLPKDNVAIQSLTQYLAERGQTIDGLVNLDHQGQAADQLSIGNSIASLRALGALDWKEFVEGQSAVERVLRQDPAGVYERMDFACRDRYRHVVEELARRSPLTEPQVARIAVEHAQDAPGGTGLAAESSARREETKQRHVGYYLVDRGRLRLEESIGYRSYWFTPVKRLAARSPLTSYLGAILLVWLLTVGAAVAGAWSLDAGQTVSLLVLVLFAGAASQFAVSLVNWLCTLLVPPRPIMRLDFAAGIPAKHRTLVAVPTMLTSEQAVRSLVDQLEVRYLANQDDHLLFALVTDFPDAEQETMPSDRRLLELTQGAIQRLNQRYCQNRSALFYLFHRPRKWNPREGVWLGEERKRGKLGALNRLLRTGATEAFSVIVGDLSQLAGVRYVITLDTDTRLPRDVGRELVGCMAHPLNRPLIDPKTRRVVEGYSILQPRVATTIPDAQRSPFSRLFAGDAGIDPYTGEISDVYQDVFAQGSFIGKGIYDVYAFEATLEGRFPDNRVLSHDLIEGCFARSGLVNDVDLFEGFPTRLLADMSRRHRWLRGDWQIAAWLGPRTPTASGHEANPLSGLSWWKIFDNLRRSLTPVFLLGFLLLGWSLASSWAGYWTLLAVVVVFGPSLLSCMPGLFRKPEEKPWTLHAKDQASGCLRSLGREAISLSILPYTVHCHLDAIARTLYRLHISRRRLLEWTTAGEAEVRSEGSCRDHYEVMWACTVASLGVAALLAILDPPALTLAAPVLLTWIAGPWLAWRISQPSRLGTMRINLADRKQIRRWARQTWHYFDTFVTEQDHWLPPDNAQERPDWAVATRTSPTNIGMGLLANLAAYDLGYLPGAGLVERTGHTLHAMQQLERYRGHFYNWYDTRTLKPAEPRYISTVDSGNLWGALLVLRVGLEELRERPLVPSRLLDGLQDTLEVIEAVRDSVAASDRSEEFDAPLARLRDASTGALTGGVRQTCKWLAQMHAMAKELGAVAPEDQPLLKEWSEALARQSTEALQALTKVAFWTRIPALEPPPQGLLRADQQQAWEEVVAEIDRLDSGGGLREVLAAGERVVERVALVEEAVVDAQDNEEEPLTRLRLLLSSLHEAADQAILTVREQLQAIAGLSELCQQFSTMDYRFLFHPERKLFGIGFNVSEHRLDASYYDLLASEARLASFLAISYGQIPQEHWFNLGRMVTLADGEPALLSWSGSMFEYLMPMLLMPSYRASLLDSSCHAAVRRQIRYARAQGVPWGISESCYNLTDANLAYRYRAFGVPGLGLERGLGNNLVIAPYASAMAVMVTPREACANLRLLERLGYLSPYGFYDAVDYTPQRRLADDQPAVCRTVMAHHSGMTLLAFANILLGGPMPRRFLQNPLCRAHDLLLQERVSQALRPVDPEALDAGAASADTLQVGRSSVRVFDTPHTAVPEVHLLSNGKYHVSLTSAGGGACRYDNLAVTRWHADITRDHLGQFCYLRDLETGKYWSNTYQPTRRSPDKYQAVFSQGRVEYRLLHEEIDARTQVSVSPEDNVEVRRVILTNLSRLERTIEATTYAEIVLAPPETDRAHRAFSNLFLQTELVPESTAILCTRRPRTPEESSLWMFHLLHVHAANKSEASFETSRERFVGRTRSLERPAALEQPGPLTGSQGAVLDPIVSIRQAIRLPSEESAMVYIITGVAETREKALAAIERYCDPRLAGRVFELSRAQSQLMLQRLRMTEAEAQLYAHLAAALLYTDARYRVSATVIGQHLRSQDALWALGISGDRPMVLVRCTDQEHSGLVEQMLSAHAYWQDKGLEVDLVFWVECETGYRQELYDHLMGLIASNPSASLLERPGGIFVRRSDQHRPEDLLTLQAAARIYLNDAGGALEEQVNLNQSPVVTSPVLESARPAKSSADRRTPRRSAPDLLFFNGQGGFTRDGREYIAVINPERPTPAPWCNVLANAEFGAVVSESGTGYTWSDNSQQFRLTPWSNDPTCDPQGEALYICDEESGEFFSPTPLPSPSRQGYTCRHGFGYSVWETEGADLESQLWTFVAIDRPAKFFLLNLKNRTGRRRKLSVTCFVEWVLGEHRGKTSPYVITEVDPQSGALLARNAFHPDFGGRVAFVNASEGSRKVTCDRTEFLGRNGSPAMPAALQHASLSGRAGAAIDPAAVIRREIELGPGEQRDIVFVLGAGADARQARDLARRLANVATARKELSRVWEQWNQLLDAVHVETPEPSLNVLANGWLFYQTLVCRFWGRSAFYQSGGAYGFRDQLQDSMALLWAAAPLTRQHLLRCAARQFVEGDVQHWWHPNTGRGVRTRISDDYLWLPLVACKYVAATGDWGVLDEQVPFLVERRLEPHEDNVFSRPSVSKDTASLYEHCRRAIQNGLKFGAHHLPLMGAGDWNDGMNRVGIDGKGESVWLAMFLIKVLRDFVEVAGRRDDAQFAGLCRDQADRLEAALKQHAWDGQWFRRAYFDNGEPLGSAENDECQIDSLPQSWAVIAQAAQPPQLRAAMQAVDTRLVRRDLRLVQLFDPPFDQGHLQPGYIKGYLPGVRENGGQYTHAAVWTAMAFAQMGDAERAWECFRMINPVNHATSPEARELYKVEPYVMPADVYAAPTHQGRGGWTWYTGSSGWMYQLIIETLLGITLIDGHRLRFRPCPPDGWSRYQVSIRHRRSHYRIEFVIEGKPAHHVSRVTVDGQEQPDREVDMVDDGREHQVTVTLGAL